MKNEKSYAFKICLHARKGLEKSCEESYIYI